MSARQLRDDELDECPHCIAVFYGFYINAHAPGKKRNPVVQHHVAKVVGCATRRGFTHADVLATMVASGECYSESALWLATRLGEAVGANLMQAMVDEMIATLKSKQYAQRKGTAQ